MHESVRLSYTYHVVHNCHIPPLVGNERNIGLLAGFHSLGPLLLGFGVCKLLYLLDLQVSIFVRCKLYDPNRLQLWCAQPGKTLRIGANLVGTLH